MTVLFRAALAAACFSVIGIGYYIAGGPQQARDEKQDQIRYEQLIAAVRAVECYSYAEGTPENWEVVRSHRCAVPFDQVKDADQLEPSVYRLKNGTDRTFQVCTDFLDPELAEKLRRGRWNESVHQLSNSGCMEGNWK